MDETTALALAFKVGGVAIKVRWSITARQWVKNSVGAMKSREIWVVADKEENFVIDCGDSDLLRQSDKIHHLPIDGDAEVARVERKEQMLTRFRQQVTDGMTDEEMDLARTYGIKIANKLKEAGY